MKGEVNADDRHLPRFYFCTAPLKFPHFRLVKLIRQLVALSRICKIDRPKVLVATPWARRHMVWKHLP